MNNITPSNDASPTSTPNINTPDTPSTPNRTHVVSQSQGSGGIEALIEATVRTSNGVFSHMVESEMDSIEAHLYDDNLYSQVPANSIARTDPGIMPGTDSPVKRDLLVNFEHARKKRRGDGVFLRQTNYEASRLSLQRAFPFDSLCKFLRDSAIDAKLESLRNKPLSMISTMRSAMNNWTHQSDEAYPASMLEIEDLLESAPHPLGPAGRRLFLEDYMMLEPGNQLICYINALHPDFKDSKANQKLYKETCTANPLRPMKLEGTLYFAMKLTVRSNALYDSFKSGVLTKEELKRKCTRRRCG